VKQKGRKERKNMKGRGGEGENVRGEGGGGEGRGGSGGGEAKKKTYEGKPNCGKASLEGGGTQSEMREEVKVIEQRFPDRRDTLTSVSQKGYKK